MSLAMFAALLMGQVAPSAQDFAATFSPEAIASHLEGEAAYLVVGAGSPTPSLLAAAAAVEDGLRRSGRADLVMNGDSLGPVAGLDDQALVKRCDPLPVARVAVVRVFELAGEAPRAVVAVYDKQGTVQVAFTAQVGQPLAPGQKRASTGQGVSPGVAQAVLQVAGNTQAQEEYDRSFVSFDEVRAVTHGGQLVTRTTPRQGKYMRPLEGDEFYRVIGRDDLVRQYRANVEKRNVYRVIGVAVAVVVPVVALAAKDTEPCSWSDPNWFDCEKSKNRAEARAVLTAVAGVGAGIGIGVLGNLVKLDPIDAVEARRLGDEHNQELKRRLGLAQGSLEPTRRETEVGVSFVPVRGGGMVGLAVTF